MAGVRQIRSVLVVEQLFQGFLPRHYLHRLAATSLPLHAQGYRDPVNCTHGQVLVSKMVYRKLSSTMPMRFVSARRVLAVPTQSWIELTAPERKETCHPFLGSPNRNSLEEKKSYTFYINFNFETSKDAKQSRLLWSMKANLPDLATNPKSPSKHASDFSSLTYPSNSHTPIRSFSHLKYLLLSHQDPSTSRSAPPQVGSLAHVSSNSH